MSGGLLPESGGLLLDFYLLCFKNYILKSLAEFQWTPLEFHWSFDHQSPVKVVQSG
jgi:hypothetical protein